MDPCASSPGAKRPAVATYDFVKENDDLKRAFEITDMVFLVIFTIELVMQIVYHSWRIFLDGWLVFDLVIITMSWIPVGGSASQFESLQVLRALRIFRAFRLITRIKTLRDLILGAYKNGRADESVAVADREKGAIFCIA